jgi:hypothetical protein
VDEDIRVFVEYRFAIITQQREFVPDWPDRENITAMVGHAAGLSIWAVTACRHIDLGRQGTGAKGFTQPS